MEYREHIGPGWVIETWRDGKDDHLHREDGPAWIRSIVHDDGTRLVEKEIWCLDHKTHREDGPATTEWRYEKIHGKFAVETTKKWWLNDQLLRKDDGPTIIKVDTSNLVTEYWGYNRGQDFVGHNPNGPAKRLSFQDDVMIQYYGVEFIIDGRVISSLVYEWIRSLGKKNWFELNEDEKFLFRLKFV